MGDALKLWEKEMLFMMVSVKREEKDVIPCCHLILVEKYVPKK